MKKISNFDERLESEQVFIEGLLNYKYSDYLKEEKKRGKNNDKSIIKS